MTSSAPTPDSGQTARIELRLRELSQLFNSMDPSPFYEKDLDADAEDFIVGWARELPHDRPLEVVIHLTEPPKTGERAEEIERSVHESLDHFFTHKADHERREFSELMRFGRASLVLGLLFLAGCFIASTLLSGEDPFLRLVRESLIIVGWVALWRPLEIFLYDWWPIRRHMRLYRRLSAANVSVYLPQA